MKYRDKIVFFISPMKDYYNCANIKNAEKGNKANQMLCSPSW